MRFEDCFRLLADRLKDEIIVTSAGNSSELWWDITHETERVFYLEASMSLASVFAAGIALGTERTVVAFNGDGAFCMNPGMLLVERQLALPNLKHFVISNRVYGSTNDLGHPFGELMDYRDSEGLRHRTHLRFRHSRGPRPGPRRHDQGSGV